MQTKKIILISISLFVVLFLGLLFKNKQPLGGDVIGVSEQIVTPKEVTVTEGVKGTVDSAIKYDVSGKSDDEKIKECIQAYNELKVTQDIASSVSLSQLPSYIVLDVNELDQVIVDLKDFINNNCNV